MRTIGYALLGDTVLVNDICTAISALRVYAISGRRIVLPSLILLLYLPNISINIWICTEFAYSIAPPPVGCTVYYKIPFILPFRLAAFSRSCIIASDVLVLLGTWHATYGTKKIARLASMEVSTVDLLLRDGTLVFSAVLLLNITDVVLEFKNIFSYTSLIVDVLITILTSRLFLNLRQVNSSRDSTYDSPATSTIQFSSRIVGPLGAPIEHGISTCETDEDDIPLAVIPIAPKQSGTDLQTGR